MKQFEDIYKCFEEKMIMKNVNMKKTTHFGHFINENEDVLVLFQKTIMKYHILIPLLSIKIAVVLSILVIILNKFTTKIILFNK